jgi:hypothetical protein
MELLQQDTETRCMGGAASRANQEASLVSMIEIVALVCNFAGVLLLVRQGVPYRLLADSVALAHDPGERVLCGNDRRKMLSFVGVVLFALGTSLQLASIVLTSG